MSSLVTTASDTAARTTVDAATPSLRPLSYSAPLDGLRAIAVLAVFVFHNNESRLPGGFLGVDLFFVLSGYLITRLLIVENEGSGTVDLAAFWARRFRRLLPASLSVLVTVTLYVSVYGSPTELLARRGDVLWSLFYVANWRFIITDADYFSSDAETSPLRHMWSLAVEEQFYFVWPLLVALILLLTWRWAGLRVLLAVTVVLAVLSAVRMGLLYDAFSPSRAYFGTDARIHQMLIGAAIGMLQARGVLRLVRWPALVQGVMLGAVIAAMFLVAGSDRLYYGLGSFIFALIVGILIASLVDRPDSTVGRGLTWSPIKGLGGISYAFYLWHWPIIIWIAYPVGADFAERRLVDAIRFGLVLLLAAASLRFLEDPVRRGRLPFVGSHSWRSIGAAAVAMAVVGWLAVTMLTPGLDDAVAVAATDQSVEYCPDQPAPCVVSDAGGDAPVVVTMGDSTSQHLTPALVELAEQKEFTLIQSGLGGCSLDDRALAGGSGDNRFRPIDKRCRDAYEPIMEAVIAADPDLIVAATRNTATRHVGPDGELVEPLTEQHLLDVAEATGATLDRLIEETDAQIVLIDTLPRLGDVDCLAANEQDPTACDTAADADRWATYNELVRGLASERSDRVSVISLEPHVCPNGTTCGAIQDGVVVSYDGVHFTGTYSASLDSVIDELLSSVGTDLDSL